MNIFGVLNFCVIIHGMKLNRADLPLTHTYSTYMYSVELHLSLRGQITALLTEEVSDDCFFFLFLQRHPSMT